ncbi:hypothetical protein K8I28_03000 [bacterium]|nr:hypothetical protein [bacterium]
MNELTVRVPGKVMLSGEYAVLYGGSSALCPVSRYLELSEAPQNPTTSYPPTLEAALREEISIPAFKNIPIIDYKSLPPLQLNDDQFYHLSGNKIRQKLGIGSSAAQVVAGVVYRLKLSGIKTEEYATEIFTIASQIHQKLQTGIGSGADVAVCSFQQPILFEKQESGWNSNPLNLKWLKGKLNLVWTGSPANTRELVPIFTEWAQANNPNTKKQLSQLVQSSHLLADAFQAESLALLNETWRDFVAQMLLCSSEAGLPWRSEIHSELEEWAARHNCLAKPTGAGQGDMILILGDAPLEELDYLTISVV